MTMFALEYGARGTLAELPPGGVANERLFSALLDPTCMFLCQVTRQSGFRVGVTIRKNDPGILELVIQQFLFTGFDLRHVAVNDFLSWLGHARAREVIGGQLDVQTPRYLLGGLDIAEVPIGYAIMTADPAFGNPVIPTHSKTIDAWLLCTQLALERTIGARFTDALAYVHERMGPSLLAALDRVPGPPLAEIAGEVERRWGLSKDTVAALFQIGDWHADGGLARLEQMRALAASQQR